jgi:small multidrug resistance pump
VNHWLAITLAIAAEVMATSSLKASQEFTRFWPSVLVVVGYGTAFYFMTISLRVLPVGIMYAIWSGLGIVSVSVLSWLLYRQSLDTPALIGMALIIAGVVVMNVFSSSVPH